MDVVQWWRWWKRGQLALCFAPLHVPAIVIEAIDEFSTALDITREAVRQANE